MFTINLEDGREAPSKASISKFLNWGMEAGGLLDIILTLIGSLRVVIKC